MPLKFQHILTGKRMGARKEQGDTLIKDVAVFVNKIAVRGMPNHGQLSKDSGSHVLRPRPGNPDYANSALSLRGCNRSNRISVW